MRRLNILLVSTSSLFLALILFSCDSRIRTKDSNDNISEFEVANIELTTSEKEDNKEIIIKQKINDFLILNRNSISLIKNYWDLCDTAMIRPLRSFEAGHKEDNIVIGLHKDEAEVRPIPGLYKISEGPFAEYKIIDDKLGRLYSYQLFFELNDNFDIEDYYALIQFAKADSSGINRITLKKRIEKSDSYDIVDNITDKYWH